MPKMSFISSTVYTRVSYVARGGAVLLPRPFYICPLITSVIFLFGSSAVAACYIVKQFAWLYSIASRVKCETYKFCFLDAFAHLTRVYLTIKPFIKALF